MTGDAHLTNQSELAALDEKTYVVRWVTPDGKQGRDHRFEAKDVDAALHVALSTCPEGFVFNAVWADR